MYPHHSTCPFDYRNNLNIIRNITPGIPKNPAISAVAQFIPMAKLKYEPTRFTMKSNTAPKTPLIISFTSILIGHENNFTMINKSTIATKK